MNTISNAYKSNYLSGSRLTAPLRSYNLFFQNKTKMSQTENARVAWKICHVAASIFACPVLGLLAVPGILINACLISAKGNSKKMESFCEQLHLLCTHPIEDKYVTSSVDSIKRAPKPGVNALLMESTDDVREALRSLNERYGFVPETCTVFESGGKRMISIPLPEGIPSPK